MIDPRDAILNNIQRSVNLTVSIVTDHSGRRTTDQKIHALGLFLGRVEDELALRPPAKRRWWR